jgi:hypothetical protein
MKYIEVKMGHPVKAQILLRQALLGSLMILFLAPFPAFAGKIVIGQIEKAALDNSGFLVHAKIDTGARNSSLNAENYKLSRKGDDKWIRFDVINRMGKVLSLNKRIIRFAKIKRKGATVQQRPVIELEICIGTIKKQVEVNLVNRSNFNYQMLIGQSFLKPNFVVDVAKNYTRKPACQ